MRNVQYIGLAAFAVVAVLCATSAQAAVLEVTHSPGAGQYGTIMGAIGAAVNGDTIRIIDNSAPYEETVIINTPGANETLIIEGDPSLDPRPTVIGQGGVDPGGAVVTLSFGGNYPAGCTIRNLILQSIDLNGDGPEAWSTICMMRFNFNTVFENVEFDAGSPANLESALDQFWYGENVFTDCTFKGGSAGAIISMGGVSTFNNCAIEPSTGVPGMLLAASEADTTLTLNDCRLAHQDAFGINTFDLWGDNQLTVNLNRCLVTTTVTAPDIVTIAPGATNANDPIFNVDNCDFVKGAGSTGVIYNFIYYRGTALNITDTIFSGSNPGVAVWDPWGVDGVVFNDDYLVYHDCEFAATGGVLAPGANSAFLNTGDPLYVDAPNGDYRLLPDSLAATWSSGNSAETWSGSQGVQSAPPEYTIVVSPQGHIEAGMVVTLTAPAGSGYVWEKDGVPVADDARVTGSTSQALMFDPAEVSDTGVYVCYFDDGVNGAVETLPLMLNVTVPDPGTQLPAAGLAGLVACVAALALLGARRRKS